MADAGSRPPPTLDQVYAMRLAARRLEDEFDGAVGAETVDVVLRASHEHYQDHATVQNFVPLMAERFARQRLRALAHVELAAQAGVPAVLFLCVHNAGRSQMALGFFTAMAGEEAVAWSGGADPLHAIDPAVVEAMCEVGIDLGEEFPKPWTEEILRAVDVIVTMGCADDCPDVPGSRQLDWDLDDPAGQEIAAVRSIRDAIEVEVRALLVELGITPSDVAPR